MYLLYVYSRILYFSPLGTVWTTTLPSYDKDANTHAFTALHASPYTLSRLSSKLFTKASCCCFLLSVFVSSSSSESMSSKGAEDTDVAPYGATFEDGYRAAEVCDAIVRSSDNGRRETITYR